MMQTLLHDADMKRYIAVVTSCAHSKTLAAAYLQLIVDFYHCLPQVRARDGSARLSIFSDWCALMCVAKGQLPKEVMQIGRLPLSNQRTL